MDDSHDELMQVQQDIINEIKKQTAIINETTDAMKQLIRFYEALSE